MVTNISVNKFQNATHVSNAEKPFWYKVECGAAGGLSGGGKGNSAVEIKTQF